MKKIAFAAFASLAALTLSACGSSDDASTDSNADNVEMPADQAMAGSEQPVPDPSATVNDTATTDDAVSNAEAAGEKAADAAADVAAAASPDATDTGGDGADAD